MKKINTIQFLLGEVSSDIFNYCTKLYEPKKIILSSIMNLDQSKRSPKHVHPNTLQEKVYNSFWNLEFDLFQKIYDYNKINDLIEDIKLKNVDVLVTNYCIKDEQIADIIKKIIRNTKTSVFIYPNDSGEIKTINVGVDLRKGVKNSSLESSYKIAAKLNIDTVNLLNVYKVPLGYYKLGKTFDEYSKKIESNINANFESFLTKFRKNKLYFTKKLIKSKNIPKSLRKHSDKNTLLIIGDKNKNHIASLILGNECEEIIFNTESPILLERNNSQESNFFTSIMGLE